jgi:single-stranded DNA-binding protein
MLIGKLSSGLKESNLPSGKKILCFTVTTTETEIDSEGNTKKITVEHPVFAWGRFCNVMQTLKKGVDIALEGKITPRFYMKNSRKQFISEIEVKDLILF